MLLPWYKIIQVQTCGLSCLALFPQREENGPLHLVHVRSSAISQVGQEKVLSLGLEGCVEKLKIGLPFDQGRRDLYFISRNETELTSALCYWTWTSHVCLPFACTESPDLMLWLFTVTSFTAVDVRTVFYFSSCGHKCCLGNNSLELEENIGGIISANEFCPYS